MISKILTSLMIITSLNYAKTCLTEGTPLKEQLLELSRDKDSDRKKFQYGIYFGLYLKNHPEDKKDFIQYFKYVPEKSIFVIALKKAEIENTFYEFENNYVIVDPMTFVKFYQNSVQVLLGEFRFNQDQKFFDKIMDLNGTKKELESAKKEIIELAKDYNFLLPEQKIKKPKEINSTEKIVEEEF